MSVLGSRPSTLAAVAREAQTRRVTRADAEGLRRRLYAPGASTADVDRYREVAPQPAAREAPRRRRLARVVPGVLMVLVVSGILLAGAAARSVTPAVVPVVAAPTVLQVSDADRRAIREALAARDDIAVAGFLLARRAPPALRTATRSLIVEQTGTGPATVGVDPESAAAFRGRATVLLVLGRAGEAGWTTFWRRVDASGIRTLERQQQRAGRQEAGDLTTATYRYGSGEQPVKVRVRAPAGVRWAVEVVFTD